MKRKNWKKSETKRNEKKQEFEEKKIKKRFSNPSFL
jgi:hypothetical protein